MKSLLSIGLILLLAACDSQSGEKVPANDSSAVIHPPDTVSPIPTDQVDGLFTGIIPCTDCPGIRQQILFSPGGKFHLEENYLDGNHSPIVITGKYFSDGGTISIQKGDSVYRKYAVENEKIIQLDQKGNKFSGSQADKYVLKKVAIGSDNAGWTKLKNAGVDFLGIGTEPFWSIEIDEGKTIRFTRPSTDPVTVPYSSPTGLGENRNYSIRTEANRFDITIRKDFCSDGMSDTWYEFVVEVKYNDTLFKGCGVRLGRE